MRFRKKMPTGRMSPTAIRMMRPRMMMAQGHRMEVAHRRQMDTGAFLRKDSWMPKASGGPRPRMPFWHKTRTLPEKTPNTVKYS